MKLFILHSIFELCFLYDPVELGGSYLGNYVFDTMETQTWPTLLTGRFRAVILIPDTYAKALDQATEEWYLQVPDRVGSVLDLKMFVVK